MASVPNLIHAMPPKPSPNFGYLAHHDPRLVVLATQAELYFDDDPNTCLLKLRQFGELLAQHAASRVGMYVTGADKQTEVLYRLRNAGVLNSLTATLFHDLRKAGNQANHALYDERADALHQLKMSRELGIWFQRAFGNNKKFDPGPFVPPPTCRDHASVQEELERLRKEFEEQKVAQQLAAEELRASQEKAMSAEELARKQAEEKAIWETLAQEEARSHELDAKLVAELKAEKERLQLELEAMLAAAQKKAEEAPVTEVSELIAQAAQASQAVVLDESATRRIIDEQIRDAHWEVDSQTLTYNLGARPEAGKNRVISEWPTLDGVADYVFFRGLEAVAVAEAKRKNKNVSNYVDQAGRYSKGFAPGSSAKLAAGAPWGDFQVPLLFSANGRPYFRQAEQFSGIWFRDARRTVNHARALDGWYTPEGIDGLLRQNLDDAERKLAAESTDSLGLWPFQIGAIKAVEAALIGGARSCLVAMATGTGKTKTAIGMVYRLLKTKRFRRVLFLVDRSALGDQALKSLMQARMEGVQLFTDIFDVRDMKCAVPGKDTRLHIATVQAMVRRITAQESEEVPAVDTYDCIVVDECHRGYSLDREIGEIEMRVVEAQIRDLDDYISKYRRVLDHFDAVKIGLTATPALHTKQIFGDPTFVYSYREAVIDGTLVDHEPPIRLVTKLGEDGIRYAKGEQMTLLDTRTSEIDLVNTEDEVNIEIDAFNRTVITENFNRVICKALADHIDPQLDTKTVVFCLNDIHADLVVTLLKEAFKEKYGEIDDDLVQKITGGSDRPLEKIQHFKNERAPNVAVTVDLLSTGIDVPRIGNIVFLRRVKSRILYEQMLGRATRKCPEIDKECFQIFDAVDLYKALEPFSSMKPVVVTPTASVGQLVRELELVGDPEAQQLVLEQLIAKLQRKKQSMKGELLTQVEDAAKMPLKDMIKTVRGMSAEQAVAWFKKHPFVTRYLDHTTGGGQTLLVSDHADELRRVEHGYGGATKPEDYLEGFRKFVTENLNTIPALLVVAQRPRELTRAQLKELAMLLGEKGFTEQNLRAAWRDKTNADIAATILGFVRQAALGDPLVAYEKRVDRALEKILSQKPWSKPQREWLKKIANQITEERVVDRAALDMGIFKKDGGGFERLNKSFDGHLEELLSELTEAIWSEVG